MPSNQRPTVSERIRAAFDGDDVARKNVALRIAHDEIERLRRFAQYVADFSNDPLIVQEALRHVR